MSEPLPRQEREPTETGETERRPWQKLGFDKMPAADASGGSSGVSDGGATYS